MKNIAFIGLGNMGKAIASGLIKSGAVAAGNVWGYDPYTAGLSAFCNETGANACASAQDVCSLMVESGIKAIWNFASSHLDVPEDVWVQNENMAASVALLSGHLTNNQKIL